MFRLLLPLLFLALPAMAMAAELTSEPVKNEVATATLLGQSETIAPYSEYWVAVKLDMPPDWHTYWINPGDTGLAASVTPQGLPDGISLSSIYWPIPQRFEVAGLINYGYHDEVLLLMQLQLSNEKISSVPLTVKADWLVCKDICIPESATLSLEIPVGAESQASERFAKAVKALPLPMKNPGRYNFDQSNFWIEAPIQGQYADTIAELFFPGETIVSTARPAVIPGNDTIVYLFERGAEPHKDGVDTVIVKNEGNGTTFSSSHDPQFARPTPPPTAPVAPRDNLTLPLALLLALLGGLVLNLMPCVLPVLSLKVLGLVKKAGISRRAAATQGLAYTGGILVSFLAVAGALIALQQGGTALGWGYQLQSPVFVLGLAAIMFGVGLNLSGVFTVPGVLGTLGQKTAAQETAFGSFMTGVLATLVATPCTAPFMASAIGFALTLPPAAALAVFAALGLGLALPYLLVSLFPALRTWLPKPGAWMESFKQFLAFPMYATAAWLLWVLSTQTGPDALAVGLALLLLIGLLAWWSQHATTRPRKLALMLTLFLLGGLMLLNVRGMSEPPAVLASSESEKFSIERLDALRASGKPVFVNATANWCITCKVNERLALSRDSVQAHFRDAGITVLVADWTNRDPAIGEYLASFGRSGVPTYVYYPPQGEPVLLPQLLTAESVINQTSR